MSSSTSMSSSPESAAACARARVARQRSCRPSRYRASSCLALAHSSASEPCVKEPQLLCHAASCALEGACDWLTRMPALLPPRYPASSFRALAHSSASEP